jgi:preprotein translocase subunit SecE
MKEGEVADKNRGRSVDDGDDRPDDVEDELEPLADDADDAADDEENDDLDDLEGDETDDEDAAERADGEPTKARKKKVAAGAVARSRSKDTGRRGGGWIIGRLARFVREIVAELQKVIWPTRKELLTYTTVVVVFVAVMMTFVSLLDVGFAKVMFFVFGGGSTGTTTTTK